MHKCRELSKLPKAKSIKSVNFRRTTPGCLADFLGWKVSSKQKTAKLLDASHPAAKLRSKTAVFPHFSNAHITIRAFPKALLKKPDVPWPNPPYNYVANLEWSEHLETLRKTAAEGKVWDVNTDLPRLKIDFVNMSLSCVVGKKAVHKSAVIRGTVVRRLKTAISLIVTRGADVHRDTNGEDIGQKESSLILHNDANINPHQWILPGWAYLVIPTLPIYRMPYPELISILRDGLGAIHTRITTLEAKWMYGGNVSESKSIPRKRTMQSNKMDSVNRSENDLASGGTEVELQNWQRPEGREGVGLRGPSVAKRTLLKSVPPLSPRPSSSASHPYGGLVPRIRATKSPFGLRPPPAELVPTIDSFMISEETSSNNDTIKLQSDHLPSQTLTSTPSSPTTIPRLFFPTLTPNPDAPPSTMPTPDTGSGNIQDKLFQNRKMIRLPHAKALPGAATVSRSKR